MKSVTLHILILLFFFVMTGLHAEAQTTEQRNRLIELSETYARVFEEERSAAVLLADSLGIPVRQELEDGRVFELMRFVDGIPRYYITHNAEGAELIRSDRVYPGGGAGFNLTGAGQTLGIWDAGGVLTTHDEFTSNGISRVTQQDSPSGTNGHATHVAGTMVAAGDYSAAKGMSWEAMLDAYYWDNDQSEMAAAAASGLQVSQHSYGLITGWAEGNWSGSFGWHWFGNVSVSDTEDYRWGFYSDQAADWDEIAYNAPEYLIVKSAGNDRGQGPSPGTEHFYWNPQGQGQWQSSTDTRELDGGDDGYTSISEAGVSKNLITVGAVNASENMSSFSGWGPTDDGRIKPDVVAKGVSVLSTHNNSNDAYASYSGTSMSGPMVSGSIGLLLEHQENLHPGETLTAATLRALILHSADDIISGNPGPDYRYGWGLTDTQRAVEIMEANKDNESIHIYETTLNQGVEYTVTVQASGQEPLRTTIAWTDTPGTPPDPALNPPDLMLVNDLDMRVTDPTDDILKPYVLDPANPGNPASTGDNFRDNVEMIHIASPEANALYEITISHKGNLDGNSQDFSLIVTGNSSVTETHVVTLSALPEEGGDVTGDGIYAFEEQVTVEALPATGYHFDTWNGDIQHLDDAASEINTFTMPDEDVTLVAEFVLNTYTLLYTAGENGSLEGNTHQTVDHGSDGTPVEAIPDEGYHFLVWSDEAEENPRTDTNVTDDLNVTAHFAINTYTITAAASPPEGGSISGSGDYAHGQTVTLEATPETGYTFTRWTENGSEVSADEIYTFTATENRDLVAEFALETYTVVFIVESEHGESIPDAVITLGDTENEAGAYIFENVLPGEYDYSVVATGYFDVSDAIEVTNTDLQIEVIMEVDDTGIPSADLPKPGIYPNPADDKLYVDLKHHGNLPVTISLINMHGQIVRSTNLQDGFCDQVVLHVEDLLPGIYLLNIRFDDMQFTERILIE